MRQAPRVPVLEIIEVAGERGGVILVHVLKCGHWLTRRKAATECACIGCVVEQRLKERESDQRMGRQVRPL
jgi:hypothetical protein